MSDNITQKFWKWVDEYGGEYRLGKATGRPNGTPFINTRKRGGLPKTVILEEIAEKIPGFPAHEFILGYPALNSDASPQDQPAIRVEANEADTWQAREIQRLREELKRKNEEIDDLKRRYDEKDALVNEAFRNFPRASDASTGRRFARLDQAYRILAQCRKTGAEGRA